MVLLAVAAPVAAATGWLLVRHLPWFIADEAGMRLLRPSSGQRRWSSEAVPIVCGLLLAVAVLTAFAALTHAAEAPAGTRRIVTVVCAGAGIGAAAGATPILAWVDVRIHRLPDRIVLPLLGLTAVLWTLAALSSEHALTPAGHGPGAALGIGAVCGVVVLIVSVVGGRGRGLAIGLGDVKLAILLGALAGLSGTGAVLAAFVVAHVSACIDAGWRVLVQRRGWGTRLAYGPHLLLGMWTGPLVYAALR